MAEELSRVERLLSDGLSMLQQQTPAGLRPNVQPRGYADRQLLALGRTGDGVSAITAAVRHSAERTRSCGVCGAAGRARPPGEEDGKLRQATQWLIQRHSKLAAGPEGGADSVQQMPLLLAPRWRLDLADRALVLEAAPFACPCCATAMRPELLLELADVANASGGTGTPAAAAIDEVADGYATQCRLVGNENSRLTLQDAASLAHTLELMAGGLPPLSVWLNVDGTVVQVNERTGPELVARMLGVSPQKVGKKQKKGRKSEPAAVDPPPSPQLKPRPSKKQARSTEDALGDQTTAKKKRKTKKQSEKTQDVADVGRTTRSAPGKLLGTLSSEKRKKASRKSSKRTK